MSTVRWFGNSWGAPVNDNPQIDVPVGEACVRCQRPFQADDRGVAIPRVDISSRTIMTAAHALVYHHLHCFMTEIMGPP